MYQLKDSELFLTRSLNAATTEVLRVLPTSHREEQEDPCGLSSPTPQHPQQCLAQAHLSAVLEVLTELSQDPSLLSASHPHLSNKNKTSARIQALGSVRRGLWDTALVLL